MASKKKPEVRTVVRFVSAAFNCTEVKEYFINPCCFGDDVGKKIRAIWEAEGFEAEEPFQEDWGWSAPLKYQDTWYYLNIGCYDSDSPKQPPCAWLVFVIRKTGFLPALFGGEHTGIKQEFLSALHSTLAKDADFQELCWFYSDEEYEPPSKGAVSP